MLDGHKVDLIQEEKNRLRRKFSALLSYLQEPGKVAQRLRSFPTYRRARRIFVSPSRDLSQIRINCLLDGKELIMPGPAMKDGFFGFKPYSINFTDLEYAVSFVGMRQYGKQLDLANNLEVDLFLTDGLVVGGNGGRLGDGNGFFDLAFALLVWSCPGNAEKEVGMVCNEEQVVNGILPGAPWDVPADFYMNSSGWEETGAGKKQSRPVNENGPIYWQQLTEQRIKKVSPLWKIWKNRS